MFWSDTATVNEVVATMVLGFLMFVHTTVKEVEPSAVKPLMLNRVGSIKDSGLVRMGVAVTTVLTPLIDAVHWTWIAPETRVTVEGKTKESALN